VPCRPKHGPRCGSGHVARRAEILSTTRPSCSCRAGTAQNISCRAVLRVVPKDRAMTRPQMARPKSQLYAHGVGQLAPHGKSTWRLSLTRAADACTVHVRAHGIANSTSHMTWPNDPNEHPRERPRMHDRAIQAMRRASHASRGTWAARPSERGNVPATWDRRVRRCSSGFRRCFLPVSAAVSRPTRHDTTDPNDPFLSLSGLQKSTCRDVCCVERAIGDRSKRCKMLVLSRTLFFKGRFSWGIFFYSATIELLAICVQLWIN
jgi:hypothetical protein